MISIMLFHQPFMEDFFFRFFHICGHWGVDMFLIVSGFGIAHSLTKNSRKQYYRNRINRMLPACLIFGFICLAVTFAMNGGISKRDCVLAPLSLNRWYIFAIALYYLAAPFLIKPVQRWKWKFFVVAWVLCFLVSTIDLFVIFPVNWAIWRFPAFLSGMVLYCSAPWKLGRGYLAVASLLVAVLFCMRWKGILFFGADAYIYIILSFALPALCYLLGSFEFLTDKIRMTNVVKWMGKLSLHIYLSHELCYHVVHTYSGSTPPLHNSLSH